jgi:hypothetical protein
MREMSNDESDLAQAYRLLAALQENIIDTSRLIEEYQRQRWRGHPGTARVDVAS